MKIYLLTACFIFLFFKGNSQQLSFDKTILVQDGPRFIDMIQCNDGDFLMLYNSGSTIANAFPIIRLDSAGNVLWKMYYSNAALPDFGGSSVIEAANGDFIISCSGYSQSTNKIYLGLIRISSQGTFIWDKLYTSGSTTGFNFTGTSQLVEADDGSIYLETEESNNSFSESMTLLRFSASGNLIWGRNFGTTPWMNLRRLAKAPACGVLLAAQQNPGTTFNMITVDSSGALVDVKNYAQWGFVQDMETDSNNRIKAILTRNSTSAIRLIEFDTSGNISSSKWTSILSDIYDNLLWYNGGYISAHGSLSVSNTRIYNWSSSPSAGNTLTYSDSTDYVCSKSFQAGDGSIYLAGEVPFTADTRLIKTSPMTGNDFESTGCSQSVNNNLNYSLVLSTPASISLTMVPYTPVAEFSNILVQANAPIVIVVDNCIGYVSATEVEENNFKVFPNPADDALTVTGNFAGETEVEIFSVTGKLLVRNSYSSVSNKLMVNTANLPEGVYFLRVNQSRDNSGMVRFVVSR
ncbi:MAG: T9SS type A sorting domain-containing protein [Bacteroidia bacterium]|jgi:hypothetical protein|nr:T9SS type A sorting domain-containing protein [Bacteroidia bacterium]